MSPPTHPLASRLPGLVGLTLVIDWTSNSTTFTDSSGQVRILQFSFWSEPEGEVLTICANDGSMCSFKPCPSPNGTLWFASGLVVVDRELGISSHIYALARDLLGSRGYSITPSGNLFPDGVAFWKRIDPTAQFRERSEMPGYYEFIEFI